MSKNDKIEIDIDSELPPGIMFSTVCTDGMTSREVYSLKPQRAMRIATWTPTGAGIVPGYDAALFLRLLSSLYSRLTGRKDSVLEDKWEQCLYRYSSASSLSVLCIVCADVLMEVTKVLAKVAALGVSGFFLKDLLYLLRVAQGNNMAYLHEVVSVHSSSALTMDSYLKDVRLYGLPLVEEKDAADIVMYKVNALIEACTSDKDYEPPMSMTSIRYRAGLTGFDKKLEKAKADSPDCRFATDTFDSIPVIISEDSEDAIEANIPAEFVEAADPLLERVLIPADMTRLQAMVRMAQSLFTYIPRILVTSPRIYPDLRYGVHLHDGTQRVLPASLDSLFMHDITPQKIITH